jgi:hypothetical protein
VRLYLDEGAPMLALLHHALRAPDPVLRAQAERLLERAMTSVEPLAEPKHAASGKTTAPPPSVAQ